MDRLFAALGVVMRDILDGLLRVFAGGVRLMVHATGPERSRLVCSVVVALVFSALVAREPTVVFFWVASVWYWVVLYWDVRAVHDSAAFRRRFLTVMESRPTGAPRTALVRCPQGGSHRFTYGPAGWDLTDDVDHQGVSR